MPFAIDTELICAGEPQPRVRGAVVMPVFQTAMYETAPDEDGYHDVPYIRLNNTPNQLVLHDKLAALEGGEAALVAASGMAAISATLLANLSSGDQLLVQDSLYGGTHSLVRDDLPRFGVQVDALDVRQPDTWKDKLTPNAKVIYVEAMTNPLVQVGDLKAVVEFARAHGLKSMIDSTFATPVNFRPLELGFDIVLHSATKYLNGHSDIVAGAAIGSSADVEQIRHVANHIGGTLDPHACFLLHRGVKTLALRVRHQNSSAMKIAKFLEGHDAVSMVRYPGLVSHPDYARAKTLFSGFGGMLSFELAAGAEAAQKFLSATKLAMSAPSLGGVETLVTRPAKTSHAGVPKDVREAIGITDGLVRMSVGIEDPDDLIDDFRNALASI